MHINQEKLDKVLTFGKELYRDTTTPDIEQVAGLFPRGFISIVASMAGTGKTWLMQYIACQLSVSGEILKGLDRIERPYKSVIFSGETGTFLLDKRLSKTNWEYQPRNIKIYSSIDMMLNNMNCMLNTAEGQETIIAIVYQEKPDIVFFDTLISFHTLDESRQGDMTAIYLFLMRIARSFNCAVVINHHTRKRPSNDKGRKFTQEDVIGTSAGVRLANAVYIITSEDIGGGKSRMLVENCKSWDKKKPPFTYEFTDNQGYVDFKINLEVSPGWSLRDRLDELLKTFNANSFIEVDVIAKALHINTDRARYLLDDYVQKGILQRERVIGKNAFLYTLTAEYTKDSE